MQNTGNKIIESKLVAKERIQAKLRELELPHLYAHKFYPWSRKYWDSQAPIDILVAPNQAGKSATSLRRLIHRLTQPSLWPVLWPRLFEAHSPLTYPSTNWYLYPTLDMATREFEEKWSIYLPKGSQKNSPQYGWRALYDGGNISSLEFNLGPKIYFLSYAMGRTKLQGASCHSVNLDEEPKANQIDELLKRVSATEGYLSMVFTATEAQSYWIDVVETKKKIIPGANIQQVSLFDCQLYEDGSPSHWTKEKIAREIALCSTEKQVQRRVYGRIVKEEGLKYETFDRAKNLKTYHELPRDWLYYAGIDSGGGGTSHPAAVGVIAVNPEYTKGRLVRGWRGDGILTSAEDILNVYRQIVATLPMPPVQTTYDWAAKDLATIGGRMGLGLVPAEKSHALGEHTLNTLFKNGALVLMTLPKDAKSLKFDAQYLQTDKLIWELESLSHDTKKNHAKDDAIDGWLRYIVTKVPWNWEGICGEMNLDDFFTTVPVVKTREQELRKDANFDRKWETSRPAATGQVIDEIEEFNEWSEF